MTFSGGATIALTFTSNYPAAAHSAIVTFTSSGGTQRTLVPLGNPCGPTTVCATFSAPVATNQSLQILVFASAGGTGSPLAVGNAAATTFSSQTTSVSSALSGIMASYTVSLSPASVTVGTATNIQVTENAVDASNEPLAAGYVTTLLTAPQFSVALSDASGLSSTGTYSGVGNGPISYTVTVTNATYPPATASLAFTAAAAFTPGFAIEINTPGLGSTSCTLDVYAPANTSPARHYLLPACIPGPRFDQNGVLWISNYGISVNGTIAGPFTLPGLALFTFDVAGNAYMSDPTIAAIDQYRGSALVRQIVPLAQPYGVAVDYTGNVYVGFGNPTPGTGIAEYPPTGTGALTPIATNASALFLPAVDANGAVYAAYPSGASYVIGVWPFGTFGGGSPIRSIAIPSSTILPSDFAVGPAGDVYLVNSTPLSGGYQVYYAPAGAPSMSLLFTAPPNVGNNGIRIITALR